MSHSSQHPRYGSDNYHRSNERNDRRRDDGHNRDSRHENSRKRSRSRSRSRDGGYDRKRSNAYDSNRSSGGDRRGSDRDRKYEGSSSNRNSMNNFNTRDRVYPRKEKIDKEKDYDQKYPIQKNEVLISTVVERPEFSWKTALGSSMGLDQSDTSKSNGLNAQTTNDELTYDTNELEEIQKFIEVAASDDDDDSVDEEQRLLEESRKRREEIARKYQQEKNNRSNATPNDNDNVTESKDDSNINRDNISQPDESMNATTMSMIKEQTSIPSESKDRGVSSDDDEDTDIPILTKSKRSSSISESAGFAKSDVQVTDATVDDLDRYKDHVAQIEAERQAVEAEVNNQRGKVFDMFSSSPSDPIIVKTKQIMNKPIPLLESDNRHLQSNWDDSDGYYKARIGEVIADRYHTLGIVGKGVFSTVLKCLDTKPSASDVQAYISFMKSGKSIPLHGPLGKKLDEDSDQMPVALKLIRNNDTMRKAAEKEKQLLQLIASRDSENRKHCVKLYNTFEYRNHIAFVFEYQAMNLREALKKFGKDVGINIGAIRLYGKQLFIALKLLFDLNIIHADIKLDNILCSEDLKQVKLCDFGSGFQINDPDNVPTPYLVSRFYRAPEIMMGLPCK